jgi:hypothetical protein
MKRLLNFTRDYVDNIYNIYEGGLDRIRDLTGVDVINGQLPVLLSQQYFIRDFCRVGEVV